MRSYTHLHQAEPMVGDMTDHHTHEHACTHAYLDSVFSYRSVTMMIKTDKSDTSCLSRWPHLTWRRGGGETVPNLIASLHTHTLNTFLFVHMNTNDVQQCIYQIIARKYNVPSPPPHFYMIKINLPLYFLTCTVGQIRVDSAECRQRAELRVPFAL